MKIKMLSNYNNDMDTRFGDCILSYDASSVIIYDCGHKMHAEEVEKFLSINEAIKNVYIVISHNDTDHVSGVISLLKWLKDKGCYSVNVYAPQYLKYVDEIYIEIDDDRRKRERLKEAILSEYNNIKDIINTAMEYDFETIDSVKGTAVYKFEIVGPTKEEFIEVVAKAIDNRESDVIGEGDAAETVMNAASVQLKIILENGQSVLLCGDASPDYLKELESYDIIQLPHHGQLSDAKAVFEKLDDVYEKEFLISDNTGSGVTSGGSEDLVSYMKTEKMSAAYNTQNGVVELPRKSIKGGLTNTQRSMVLGDLDCF